MVGIGKQAAIKLVDQSPVLVNKNWEPNEITILRTWATVTPKKVSSKDQDGQVQLTQFFEFKFRYRRNIAINANTRIIFYGNRYAIQSIDHDEFEMIITSQATSFS